MNRFIYKLERKMPWFAIPNLMLYIVVGMVAVYLCGMFFPAVNAQYWLALIPSLVAQGQVWRLITFIFIPTGGNVFLLLLSLYFYYFIGSALENSWGSFGFTLFYFVGMLGTIIASLFTGIATNSYLNLSLFFAFAILYPDEQFMLFFIIPVKAKYLAIIDAVMFVIMFIFGTWPVRAAIIASLLNLLLFFGDDLIRKIKNEMYYRKTRENFKREMRNTDNRYR